MRKILVILLLTVLVLTPLQSLAAGKAEVTKEAFFVRPFLGYHAADIYAEVTNTGDKPVVFNNGLIELFGPDGDAIESDTYFSCYPAVLAAGESGYLYSTVSVDEATEASYIDDYMLTVSAKSENEKETVRMETSGTYDAAYGRSKYFTEATIFGNVKNTTGDTLRGLRVVFVLFDKDDKLLYASSTELYNVGVPAGQTVEVRTSVDRRLVEAWDAEGITPDRVEIIGYVENEL